MKDNLNNLKYPLSLLRKLSPQKLTEIWLNLMI